MRAPWIVALLVSVVATETRADVPDDLWGDRRSAFFIKGGVGKLTDGPLVNDIAPWVPVFGAGFSIQPADYFGMDFIYEGARMELAGPVTDGSGEHAALWRHGGTVLFKFGAPAGSVFYPYIGAGLGATWLVGTGPGQTNRPVDALLEVPLAAGIDLRSQNFLLGLRFTYRFLVDQWIVRTAGERDDSGGLMDLQLIIGVRF